MGTVSTYTFSSDTETVTKTKLNNLVANLLAEFNGNIENANIKAGAAIANSKLNLASIVQDVTFGGIVVIDDNGANGICQTIDNDGTEKALYITQGGVLADDKYSLHVYSNAIQVNSQLIRFHQDNASSTKHLLYMINDGTGDGAELAQNGVLAGGEHGFSVYSNAAQVNADSALVKVTQDNASSTEPVLELINDGIGITLEIDSNGSHASSKVIGILIDVDNADTGDQIALDIDQVDEAKSYFARFNATTAWTSTKDPETHAEAGWIKIMVGTTAYFIPYYAAS